MATGYVHVEADVKQSPKRPGAPCGDLTACDRTAAATTLVVADGIGSGIHAHIAAEMCVSRLLGLLHSGFSMRKAFASLVRTMEKRRDPALPYAAFTIAQVRNDGMATVLSYETPPPIFISPRHASVLPTRPIQLGGSLATEADFYLEPGDGLLVVSDGITQAGLGRGLPNGWCIEGVARCVNDCLADRIAPSRIPVVVHDKARDLWKQGGDDCTVALALCRRGVVLNILTGPPANPSDDSATITRFMQAEGCKIVCGGTTAEIVARHLGQHVKVEPDPESLIAPPRYEVPGLRLVTEGAVTLNQVYNLLDEDTDELVEDSGVTELCLLLQAADRVNILMGAAHNKAEGDIAFRQQGILTRDHIIPLIADKLRAAGKLVVLHTI